MAVVVHRPGSGEELRNGWWACRCGRAFRSREAARDHVISDHEGDRAMLLHLGARERAVHLGKVPFPRNRFDVEELGAKGCCAGCGSRLSVGVAFEDWGEDEQGRECFVSWAVCPDCARRLARYLLELADEVDRQFEEGQRG